MDAVPHSVTTPAADVAAQIIERGSARIGLDQTDTELIGNVMSSAPGFFSQSEERKRRHSGEDQNFGFRPMGIEYGETPERPDVNESFSIWSDRGDLVANHNQVGPFLDHILAWQKRLVQMTAGLFEALVEALGGSLPEPVEFARASSVQVNSTLTAPPDRTIVQDRHEDGHLVTLLHAVQPGLEIGCNPTGTPTVLAPNELFVLPGSLLTLVSDGQVPPLFHQVRNLGIVGRISVMYFVNPQPDRPLYDWTKSDGSVVNVPAAVADKPAAFGLPAVPNL